MTGLVITGLCAGYEQHDVLHSVQLEVRPGEAVALLGSNGAGKTTLVNAINGLLPIRGGRIDWNGEPLNGLSAFARVQRGVVTVAEGRNLFPECTVEENLLAASMFGEPKKRRADNLQRVFDMFPRLRERVRQQAGSLSGGEQQMVAIARALMAMPRLLILDEPSTGLAPKIVQEIFAVLGQLYSQGLSVLLVEQNVEIGLASVNRSYVLLQGKMVLQGTAEEIARNPQVREAYLGI